ncbi:MAG: hypothetical protein L3J59_06905 [Methylococcaceae bacterium]|nr:hypothetical protein [Methylococcaceae bacterium]
MNLLDWENNISSHKKTTEQYKRGSELQQEEIENQLIYQKNLKKYPDLSSKTHPLIVLSPYHLPKVATLPKKRKIAYLKHIQQLIKRVVEDNQSGKNTISIHNKQYPPSNMTCFDKERMIALNEMVCGECKGRCCLNGNDNAFLDVETIKRYMKHNPELSSEQVLQNYESMITEKTHLMSCINHAETGCNLARDMRSDMCNNFYCSTLKELNTTFYKLETIPEGAVVISRFLS